jgi:hypothetical protein
MGISGIVGGVPIGWPGAPRCGSEAGCRMISAAAGNVKANVNARV